MEENFTGVHLEDFTDADRPLFLKWLNEEHVKPWFTDPQSWIEEVDGRNGEYSWIRHYIIYDENIPVGFCQFYPYWKSGEDWHGSIPLEGVYSIDYMIGERTSLRRGCASAAIRILSRIIAEKPDSRRIIVQPERSNYASRKALLSAGYDYDEENRLFILECKSKS